MTPAPLTDPLESTVTTNQTVITEADIVDMVPTDLPHRDEVPAVQTKPVSPEHAAAIARRQTAADLAEANRPKPPHVPIVNGRLICQSLDAQWRVAQLLFRGRVLPKTFENAEAAWVFVVAWQELGVGMMDALGGIGVIEGKPALYGKLPMTLVMRTGQLQERKVEWSGLSPDGAVTDKTAVTVTLVRRVTRADGSVDLVPSSGTFSMGDAKQAELLGKKNWRNYPKDLLIARATSRAISVGFPDALMGMPVIQPEDEDAAIRPREVVNTAGLEDTIRRLPQAVTEPL